MTNRTPNLNRDPNPWSAVLHRAAWWTLGVAVVAAVISTVWSERLIEWFGYEVGLDVTIEPLGASVIGLFLVAIMGFLLAGALKTVPPASDHRFWIKRAIGDSLIATVLLPFLLGPFVGVFIPMSTFTDRLIPAVLNPLEVIQGGAFALTPLALFLGGLTAQHSLGAVVLVRSLARAMPPGTLRFSWRLTKRDVARIVGSILVVLVAETLYNLLLSQTGVDAPTQFTFTEELRSQFWLLLLGGVILAPLAEELFFRGYLLPILTARSERFAIGVTAILFTAIHLYPIGIPIFLLDGIVLGVAYLRSKNLLVPFLIHAGLNLIAFGLLFATNGSPS